MSADSAAAQPTTPDSLIEQCLAGDQVAWEQIVRQNWRKVFNVAYKFVGKHDEAEDLTQDIFLKIFKALNTFDRRAKPFRTLHRNLRSRWQIRSAATDILRASGMDQRDADRAVRKAVGKAAAIPPPPKPVRASPN